MTFVAVAHRELSSLYILLFMNYLPSECSLDHSLKNLQFLILIELPVMLSGTVAHNHITLEAEARDLLWSRTPCAAH